MKNILFTVSYACLLGCGATSVWAQSCVKVPTCSELGYTTAAGGCPAAIKSLKCPFDNNYVYCPEDCREYKLSSCDSNKGSCVQCGKGDNWKYDSCKQGWYLSGYDCVENECAGYPLTVDKCETAKGTCTKSYCYAGTVAKTYYTSCKEGWTLNAATKLCDEKSCSGYGSSSSTINGCRSTSSCKQGYNTYYKCAQCYTGYSLSNGTCSKTCNYTATGLPSHCSKASSCVLGSSAGEKTYYAATCTTCESGYSLTSGGLCERKKYAVGDIYYYNNTAIGVVYFDNGSTTKIVALKDINANGQASSATGLYWSTNSSGNYSYDVDGLTNITDESTAIKDMDGKSNTQKILSYIKSKGYTAQAATATSKYAPSVCANGSICGAGEWYLPALGELVTQYNNISTISSKLSSAGGEGIVMSYYWSSTEYTNGYAWYVNFISGLRSALYKYYGCYVRPVLAF